MLPPKLITIVPVFNEAATIASVVERALAYGPVLVVDDGSTDDTGAGAAQAGAEVIRHPRRLGKGQAIRTGMRAAAIRGASAVVTLDGDGQHDPADIDRLLAAAAAAPSALIVGSRLEQASGLVRGRLNAIRVAGFFMNWVTGVRVEDTQSGFRLYPLDVVRELPTRRGGFVFETEVLVAAARRGVAVREVPVRTVSRAARRSRFRPIVDGVLIGAYLAERSLARCLVEGRDAAAAVGAVFSRQRRAARHGALLLEASVYRHAPALWAMALGTGAAHQAGARLLRWWRHPRRRRAAAAAASATVSPLLLGAVVCQSVVDVAVTRLRGRAAPDLVTPIVARWFSQARLVMLDAAGPRMPATDAAHDLPAPLRPPAMLSPSGGEGATALR
jgi:glycosyl transferase family 2